MDGGHSLKCADRGACGAGVGRMGKLTNLSANKLGRGSCDRGTGKLGVAGMNTRTDTFGKQIPTGKVRQDSAFSQENLKVEAK